MKYMPLLVEDIDIDEDDDEDAARAPTPWRDISNDTYGSILT